ncbi:hypothetical protein GQ54DRAFT_299798 [Martensiomyces pterosporus]|nr:hypothetical protein GQ54DRAFT_299798 [Martensiomyces pterosporus]
MVCLQLALLGAAALAGLSAAAPAPATTSSSSPSPKGHRQKTLVVFGDSLSDIGSGWKLANFDSNYQPPPWFEGRFSSGFVWNEWTADDLNMTLANYAYGGATSDNSFVNGTVPSVADQVVMYGKQKDADRYVSPDEDVVAVEIGSNDIFHSVTMLAIADEATVSQFAKNLTSNIITAVDKLAGYGYKSFLVFNIPPIQITPMVVKMNLTSLVAPIVDGINSQYSNAVNAYKKDHPKLNVTLVDTSSLTATIAQNLLPDLNIKHNDTSCVVTDQKNHTTFCTNPDEYFFMDAVHPTRLPHRLIGYIVSKIIQDNTYKATVDDMREMIKAHRIRNAYEAVEVTEYQADGSIADINSQIKNQATRAESTAQMVNNGFATPYSLDENSGLASDEEDSWLESDGSASHTKSHTTNTSSKNSAGSIASLSIGAGVALLACIFA